MFFLFLLRAAGGVMSVFYIRVQRYRRVGGRVWALFSLSLR